MPQMLRYEQAGAIFSEDLSSVASLRKRGTVNGNPTVADGGIAKYVTFFDGTNDDWISAPQPNLQASCTIMSWVYVDATETTGIIWAKRDNSGKGPTLIVDDTVSAGDLIVLDGGDVWVDSGANITLGEFMHVAITVDAAGTGYLLYLNGILASSLRAITAFTANADQPWSIASDDGAFARFKGAVADFLVFDRILSGAEILSIAANTAWEYEEVSRWDMSNINPKDLSIAGNGNDGSQTGLVSTTDIVQGLTSQDRAVEFNGTDEKIDCGDVGSIRTISLLVKPITTTEEFVLLDTGSDIMVNAGTVTYATVTADATYVDGEASTTMIANRWQHLVCVLSAAIDANNFEIATDGTNFGNIQVADVRIYSGVLTQLQVVDLYERIRNVTA